jgi:hypothetical protein
VGDNAEFDAAYAAKCVAYAFAWKATKHVLALIGAVLLAECVTLFFRQPRPDVP